MTNNGIWMSLNASTKNYKKSIGVWWLDKACSIELDVHAKYEFGKRDGGPLYTWETRNGERRSKLRVVADTLQFLNKSKLSDMKKDEDEEDGLDEKMDQT
ncbi:MAG: hypothetical protein HC803_00785 [Saprospiraceae bacterium]|nr:hypothetical protein [Saprospiraceae bacterium]